jgi:NhaP-type Na+/H+ or K+/H+ antiporter
VPYRETIISVSFLVVSFSIFVQGLTMTPLLRRMGEMPLPHESRASSESSGTFLKS